MKVRLFSLGNKKGNSMIRQHCYHPCFIDTKLMHRKAVSPSQCHTEENHNQAFLIFKFLLLFFNVYIFFYSHVHTLFGSFLPPAILPHSFPPSPLTSSQVVLPLSPSPFISNKYFKFEVLQKLGTGGSHL
jgi:hypothetical protein